MPWVTIPPREDDVQCVNREPKTVFCCVFDPLLYPEHGGFSNRIQSHTRTHAHTHTHTHRDQRVKLWRNRAVELMFFGLNCFTV